MKKFILTVLFFVASISLSNAQEQVGYKDTTWGFHIDVPSGWVTTTTEQLINALGKDDKITLEMLASVKSSGLVVNISAFPLGKAADINPNVTVAAKKVTVDPKPVEENAWVQFAGDILAKIVPDPTTLTAPEKEHINGLVGLSSSFSMDMAEKGYVTSKIYVLIDQQAWNYYILTATFNKDKAVENQVLWVINSFTLLTGAGKY